MIWGTEKGVWSYQLIKIFTGQFFVSPKVIGSSGMHRAHWKGVAAALATNDVAYAHRHASCFIPKFVLEYLSEASWRNAEPYKQNRSANFLELPKHAYITSRNPTGHC